MTQALQEQQLQPLAKAIEEVLVGGDLSKLTVSQRVEYYQHTCQSLGLNPLTKPFSYLSLNGKLVLYANRDCTDQLRKNNGVSVTSLDTRTEGDIFFVVAKGTDKHGRMDASTGAVDMKGKTGEAKANAMMKAETKAKRRLTLSICGLGMTDETEVDSIPGAKVVDEKFAAPPETATGKAPEAAVILDEKQQAAAGQEDQRPPAEQAVELSTHPLLTGFANDLKGVKLRSEANECWETFQGAVRDNAKLTSPQKAELSSKGFELKKRRVQELAEGK